MDTNQHPYFHQDVRMIVKKNLTNPNFDIVTLSHIMGLSRSQLYRKIKKKTGLSVASYVRQVRLEVSQELLQSTDWPVSKIAKAVGFNSASYFTVTFKQTFGYLPKNNRR